MEKVNLQSANIADENVAKLGELFPDVVTEVREPDGSLRHTIDVEALKARVGDVAEGKRERYQFTWPGKQDARAEAIRPIDKTLRPCKDKSVNWDTTENLYIEGDNLDALKILRETYAGKIKMIYIDPPYNTGHDFVYNDSFARSAEEERAESGAFDEKGNVLDASFKENKETNGRFHSDWCSMMYPRLVLARDLLADDGAIFISIDDNESSSLRKICDEVFGARSFVGDVIWQKTYSPRNDSKGIPTVAEHLLVYSKEEGWIPKRLPRTEAMNAGYGSPDGDSLLWASDNPAAPGAVTHQGMVYGIQHPFTGKIFYPPASSCWRVGQPGLLDILCQWAPYELRDLHDEVKRARVCGISPDEVRSGVKGIVLAVPVEEAAKLARERYEQGSWPLMYFTGDGLGGMRRKRYLDESQGRIVDNLWLHDEVGHTDEAKKALKKLFDGSAPFDTPKPVRLMKRILDIASSDNCIVLDFFSGSASMAEAVIAKNVEDAGQRRFVLVQLPEETSGEFSALTEIGEERIRRAGKKIADELEPGQKLPDVGFRVFKIDSSNFEDVARDPDSLVQDALFGLADNLKADRTPEDILYQLFPRYQIPYTASVEALSICGRTVYSVDDGKLVACFDREVPQDAIRAMAQMEPDYAVMRDASFAGDDALANFAEIFKTLSKETEIRVV